MNEYIHARIQHVYIHMQAYKCAYIITYACNTGYGMNECMHPYIIQTYIHTCKRTYMHTQTYINTHIHTYSIYSYIHTYIHTYILKRDIHNLHRACTSQQWIINPTAPEEFRQIETQV